MSDFVIYEGENKSVYDELEQNSEIQVGDTITYAANNQMGIKIYQVICKHDTKCVNKTCDRKGVKEVYNYDDYDDYERQILK